MTKKIIYFFITTFLTLACNSTKQKKVDNSKEVHKEIKKDTVRLINKSENFATNKISENIYESYYPNREYKITLTAFEFINDDEDESELNTILTISKLNNGKYIPYYTDSIFSKVKQIKFEDYNNDNVKDILIQNYSDVRSNWTYNLYVFENNQRKLTKIKGFEEIKNPKYLSKYNLIDNYVNSGQNWTSFYKIKRDSIINFDIIVYDDQTEDGTYEREYNKALQSILTKEKNSH